MGTIILGSIIFIAVAVVIYQYGFKKKSSCDCSNVDCPVKKSEVKHSNRQNGEKIQFFKHKK